MNIWSDSLYKDIIKLQANDIQIEENDIHPINDFFKCNKNYKTKKYLII